MAIKALRIVDFRNLATVELTPHPQGLNIICGNNGSGKTSLLEAIYYLGLGRSFRNSTSSRLIRHTTDKFSLYAQLVNDGQRHIPIGIERDLNGAMRLRMAEKDVSSITDLASFLPIRMINSQSHHLFESGPIFRRKYLDWGLFYQSETFLSCWRHFERVLKQRNAVLRDRRPKKELDVWTDELVKYGLELDTLRRDYIQALAPAISSMACELLAIANLEISYQSGWNKNRNYASVLADAHPEEYRSGHTQFGPHRADFDITIDAVSAKHFLSRGQQKLLICAMILAQGMLLARHANKGLIYLVDDLPSELDLQSRQKLISLLSRQQTQIFITAIDSSTICDFVSDQPDVPIKMFHVEQGSIVEMVERED
jgi:DNA replication and repair protein RecF